MKQKFRKLTFVKVDDVMPPSMSHFQAGFIGIVDGTYSQKFRGSNIYDYSLYMIQHGVVITSISWYHENQLTEIKEQDRLKAEEMIEVFNLQN